MGITGKEIRGCASVCLAVNLALYGATNLLYYLYILYSVVVVGEMRREMTKRI